MLTGRYTPKIDMFSFAVLLVQMCTGLYPSIDDRVVHIGASPVCQRRRVGERMASVCVLAFRVCVAVAMTVPVAVAVAVCGVELCYCVVL